MGQFPHVFAHLSRQGDQRQQCQRFGRQNRKGFHSSLHTGTSGPSLHLPVALWVLGVINDQFVKTKTQEQHSLRRWISSRLIGAGAWMLRGVEAQRDALSRELGQTCVYLGEERAEHQKCVPWPKVRSTPTRVVSDNRLTSRSWSTWQLGLVS